MQENSLLKKIDSVLTKGLNFCDRRVNTLQEINIKCYKVTYILKRIR